ncbi:MAG: hypothetical protein AAGB15_02070 [Pseudomonadota bacterium]
MNRFFLGVLTGLFALVGPLVAASLFLAPPATIRIGDKSSAKGAAQTRQAATDAAPQARRHVFADQGFAIESPKDWYVLSATDLKDFGALGDFAGPGVADVLLLAVSDARDEKAMSGLTLLMDAGTADRDAMDFIGTMAETLPSQLPSLDLKSPARPIEIAGFQGASVTFEVSDRAQALMKGIEFNYIVLDIAGRAVIIAEMSVPGAPSKAIMQRMYETLRLE